MKRPLRELGWGDEKLGKLKGAVRKLVEGRLGLQLPEDEGRWGWAGSVVFFDAYPDGAGKGGLLLVPEVITPHYREEESKGEIEFAEHRASPTPIQFLAIERDAHFIFPIAGRSDEELRVAGELLKAALEEVGIGAKTTSGYNIFSCVSVESVRSAPQPL